MVAGTALGLPFSPQDSVNVLKRLGAVWAIDAAESKVGEQYADNLNQQYPGMFTKVGSLAAAQVIRGGLHLPGITGHYASVPDNNNFNPTITLDARVAFTLNNNAKTGFNQVLISHYDSSTNNRAFSFYMNGAGQLEGAVSSDGVTPASATPAVLFPVGSGQLCLARMLWDSSGTIRLYSKASSISTCRDDALSDTGWNLLSTSSGLSTSIFNASTPINIGSINAGVGFFTEGIIYCSVLKVDSSTVLDVDFRNLADFTTSFACTTGQTVTVIAPSTGVDTNDPTFLPWTGENYLYNPGIDAITQDCSIAPTASEFVITGDISLTAKINIPSIPNTFKQIFGCRGAGNVGYRFGVTTSGKLDLTVWIAGVPIVAVSNANVPLGDIWVIARRVAATGTTTFFTSTDGINYSALGTAVVLTTGSIDATSGSARLAGNVGAENMEGRIYFFALFANAINSVPVLVIDFRSQKNQSSFVCGTGQTVTLNRNTTGKKLAMVTRPTWLFGTNDYLEVADNALIDFGVSEDFTALVIGRMWQTPSIYTDVLIGKWQGTAPTGTKGYQTRINGAATKFQGAIGDGNAAGNFTYFFDSLTNISFGSAQIHSMIRSGDSVAQWLNTAIGFVQTTAGFDTSNTQVLKIGDGSDIEIFAAAIFRRALSVQEISQIVSYYGAS